MITLGSLPPCYAELRVECAGYATFNHVVALPYPGAVRLPLPKATTIQGYVLWDDGRPYEFGKARVKVQAWQNYSLWLTGDVDKDGRYEIKGVPSLEMLGDESLAIDLIIDGTVPKVNNKAVIAPGLTAQSLNPGSYTLLVTDERNGASKRWISYVQAMEFGLKYREGEVVNHDIHLVPLAQIKGKLVPEAGKVVPPGAYVSYRDPKNSMGYAMPRAEVGVAGEFEVWVPATEEVTLTLNGPALLPDGTTMAIRELKAHEKRDLEWKIAGVVAGQNQSGIGPLRLAMRVLGPDGATLPRARFQLLNSAGGITDGLTLMDGSLGPH